MDGSATFLSSWHPVVDQLYKRYTGCSTTKQHNTKGIPAGHCRIWMKMAMTKKWWNVLIHSLPHDSFSEIYYYRRRKISPHCQESCLDFLFARMRQCYTHSLALWAAGSYNLHAICNIVRVIPSYNFRGSHLGCHSTRWVMRRCLTTVLDKVTKWQEVGDSLGCRLLSSYSLSNS